MLNELHKSVDNKTFFHFRFWCCQTFSSLGPGSELARRKMVEKIIWGDGGKLHISRLAVVQNGKI